MTSTGSGFSSITESSSGFACPQRLTLRASPGVLTGPWAQACSSPDVLSNTPYRHHIKHGSRSHGTSKFLPPRQAAAATAAARDHADGPEYWRARYEEQLRRNQQAEQRIATHMRARVAEEAPLARPTTASDASRFAWNRMSERRPGSPRSAKNLRSNAYISGFHF